MREAQRTALGKQAKHRVQAVSFFWGGIPRASQCFAAVNDPKPTAGPRGFLESGIPPHPLHLCASARNQKKSAQIPPRPVSSACHQPGVFRRRRPPIQDASKPSPPHRLWHTPLPLHLCVSARNQKKSAQIRPDPCHPRAITHRDWPQVWGISNQHETLRCSRNFTQKIKNPACHWASRVRGIAVRKPYSFRGA